MHKLYSRVIISSTLIYKATNKMVNLKISTVDKGLIYSTVVLMHGFKSNINLLLIGKMYLVVINLSR